MADFENKHDLELKLGSGAVALNYLVSASGTFSGLLKELARGYTGRADAVEWFVELQPGSVKMPVRGQARQFEDATVPNDEIVHDIAAILVNGLEQISQSPARPEYFNDKALQQVRALGNLVNDDLPISIRNGSAPVAITKRIVANIDDFFGPPSVTFGTVEGKLDGVNLHGPKPNFVAFEPLTGNSVECRLSTAITLDELRNALGKRVGVRGRIKTRANGIRVSVEPEELDIFESAFPTASDVRGILGRGA